MAPDFDDERVYISDMKKVLQWYNLLLAHDLLDFTEEESAEEEAGTIREKAKAKIKKNSDNLALILSFIFMYKF